MLSSRATTALRFVQALSHLPAHATRSLQDISTQSDLPHAYLEQIIPSLKRADLVISVRGAYGGYRLSPKAPSPLTALHVFQAVEPSDSHLGACSLLQKDLSNLMERHLSTLSFPIDSKRF
jgi:Rrf2 family transcriptional regulator, iron-sulfur cluster assembly transcription factor